MADSCERSRTKASRFAIHRESRSKPAPRSRCDPRRDKGFARCQNVVACASLERACKAGVVRGPAKPGRPIRRQYGPAGSGVSGALWHEQDLCLPSTRNGNDDSAGSRFLAPLPAPRHPAPVGRTRGGRPPRQCDAGGGRKLADALGVRLFETRGKRLVPTAAALALLQATHEVSAALARCEHTLGAYRDERSAPAGDDRAGP